MRVDLERVKELQSEIDAINHADFRNLEIYENGEKVEVPEDVVEEWRFTGLSNFWFLRERGWEGWGDVAGEDDAD